MNACIIFPISPKEEFFSLEEYDHSNNEAGWNHIAWEKNCVFMENFLIEM